MPSTVLNTLHNNLFAPQNNLMYSGNYYNTRFTDRKLKLRKGQATSV